VSERRGIARFVPWRTLTAIAVLLLVMRVFFCTRLRVPTGSMEPLLHGDPASGDELLVVRTPAFLRGLMAPERGDLVVFERSGAAVAHDERVAVKRVWATGGEAIRIEAGDLFVRPAGGEEARVTKEYAEFRPWLVALHHERFAAERLEAGSDALSLAENVAFDDGWLEESGARHDGRMPVRDLLFVVELTPATHDSAFAFAFLLGGAEHRWTFAPRAAGHEITLARRRLATGQSEEWRVAVAAVAPGVPHDFEFWHVDGQVGCAIDGSVQTTVGIAESEAVLVLGDAVRGVALEVGSGAVTLTRLAVWRDLHFTEPADASFAGGGEPYAIPDGALFVLGDRSSDSIDSRYFGAIPGTSVLGVPVAIVGPAGRRRLLR